MQNKKIGFIGQGWIGKNYADDFEKRGYEVVRYGLENQYNGNKEKIKDCDIVFIAVPTPTTEQGFDDGIVREAVGLVGIGATAVIKSTILPTTTESIAKDNPKIFTVHSPEFLREASAAYDAAHPDRNIIGVPEMSEKYLKAARGAMAVLPKAPYELICQAREAELIKYSNNGFLAAKVIFMNILYELAGKLGCNWDNIRKGMIADPRIGQSHMSPADEKGGRGAGGHCFIKDFAALRDFYEKYAAEDKSGRNVLKSLEEKNIDLLIRSGKDLDLLKGVYGKDILDDL